MNSFQTPLWETRVSSQRYIKGTYQYGVLDKLHLKCKGYEHLLQNPTGLYENTLFGQIIFTHRPQAVKSWCERYCEHPRHPCIAADNTAVLLDNHGKQNTQIMSTYANLVTTRPLFIDIFWISLLCLSFLSCVSIRMSSTSRLQILS